MAATRRASVIWDGDLMSGGGRVTARSSQVFEDQPVTWASRSEQDPNGKTSPEELVAAAHASCFAMALSGALAKARTPPQRLEVTAAVTFDAAALQVVSSAIEVKGRVPGIDAAAFDQAAAGAKDGCPISKMMKGNVQVTVKATLEG